MRAVASLLNIEQQQAQSYLDKRLIIKSNVNANTAQLYKNKLEACGLLVKIEKPVLSLVKNSAPKAQVNHEDALKALFKIDGNCRHCGRLLNKLGQCRHCNQSKIKTGGEIELESKVKPATKKTSSAPKARAGKVLPGNTQNARAKLSAKEIKHKQTGHSRVRNLAHAALLLGILFIGVGLGHILTKNCSYQDAEIRCKLQL